MLGDPVAVDCCGKRPARPAPSIPVVRANLAGIIDSVLKVQLNDSFTEPDIRTNGSYKVPHESMLLGSIVLE